MTADTTLADDEIAVWWMATDAVGPADLHKWLAILDEEERERADRFHFSIDRREFIAAHALLRFMLSSCLNWPAHLWRFTSDVDGKPRIFSHNGSHERPFSLSHTRGLVAAAVATRGVVGVDVERIDPRKADFAMAEEYFAPAEVQLLRAVPVSERNLCFFRLWTLKEAYLKAIGTGLGTPLNRLPSPSTRSASRLNRAHPTIRRRGNSRSCRQLTNTSFRSPPGTILMSCA